MIFWEADLATRVSMGVLLTFICGLVAVVIYLDWRDVPKEETVRTRIVEPLVTNVRKASMKTMDALSPTATYRPLGSLGGKTSLTTSGTTTMPQRRISRLNLSWKLLNSSSAARLKPSQTPASTPPSGSAPRISPNADRQPPPAYMWASTSPSTLVTIPDESMSANSASPLPKAQTKDRSASFNLPV